VAARLLLYIHVHDTIDLSKLNEVVDGMATRFPERHHTSYMLADSPVLKQCECELSSTVEVCAMVSETREKLTIANCQRVHCQSGRPSEAVAGVSAAVELQGSVHFIAHRTTTRINHHTCSCPGSAATPIGLAVAGFLTGRSQLPDVQSSPDRPLSCTDIFTRERTCLCLPVLFAVLSGNIPRAADVAAQHVAGTSGSASV
jgi:hypothetical protein